ncbi:MAG: hypothetical protein A3E81_00290 [Gammaproteobacteria bacterium RIFCSPHIGHO2_12_FULL_36_30]|nr:MAG: hypothetical protein A3E81_00290 [Gammaproteobacteria bacterium RIFCSPHIGHO2_12_FULL_36_30]
MKKVSSTESTVPALPFLEKLTGGKLTLGRAIRAIRHCNEIKQKVFAKKLGVSQAYLCDLEKDRKEVSPVKAAEFARILEHSETQFIRLALQDMFRRQGLHFTVEVHKKAA